MNETSLNLIKNENGKKNLLYDIPTFYHIRINRNKKAAFEKVRSIRYSTMKFNFHLGFHII